MTIVGSNPARPTLPSTGSSLFTYEIKTERKNKDKMKRALVLTGGSVRGAFQSGAVKSIFESGFKPDIIRGISAGALNSAFITSRIGHYKELNPEWSSVYLLKVVGEELVNLWKTNVTSYKSIINKRYIKGAFSALTGNFTGLTDNTPLKDLVNNNISELDIRRSSIDFAVGALNIKSGNMEYASNFTPSILDYVIASTALPFIMPISEVQGKHFYDGGIRDSAPLKPAIDAGADEIIIIACSPVETQFKNVDTGNVIDLLDRIIGIIGNETLKNDLETLQCINKEVKSYKSKGIKHPKREIRFKLINPEESLEVSMTNFKSEDISGMINYGYNIAKKFKWKA